MNFNGLLMHLIKNQVRFNNQDSVPGILEFLISRDAAHQGMVSKGGDMMVEFFKEGSRIFGTVAGDPVKNGDQVVDGYRKIAEGIVTRHATGLSAFSSLERG